MRSQALAAGYTEAEIDRRRRQKLWVPIRRGAYVERAVYAAMTREQLHVALVHAAVRSLAKPAVVSHVSAAVLRGMPSWGLDLSLVHVTRGDLHSPRIEGGVHHHAGELRNDDLEQIDGIWVTSPARTAIDTARVTAFEAAVVVTDALLHRGLVDRGTILDRLESMRDWPGTCNAGRVAEFADGRSESVGESRTRVAFELVGLPRPDLQRLITTPDGKFVGRSDFLFDELWTIGEFSRPREIRPTVEAGRGSRRCRLARETARGSDPRSRLRGGTDHLVRPVRPARRCRAVPRRIRAGASAAGRSRLAGSAGNGARRPARRTSPGSRMVH